MWGISRKIRGGLVTLLCALLGGWVFGLSQPVLAADSVVTDIRVGAQGGATRIVFDLTRKITFATFSLAKPDRIVIDLPEVGWQLPAQPLPAASGVFRQMRYGLFQPGNSRVVLDIQKPAAISQAYVLEAEGKQPYRLVLELVPVSRTAFLQGIGKPSPRVTSSRPTPDKSRPARTAANSGLAPPPAAAPVTVVASATKTLPPSAKLQPVRQLQASPFKLPPRKPSPRRPGQKHVIVIDSGHGGVDPGTIGISGIYEKHVTLAMARELKKQLDATGRFKAVLTRDRDIFIRLRDRVQKSRDAKAELFISIHADTVKNPKIKGPAVYTLSEKASDKEAHELAEKENKADLIAGVDLTNESLEVTNILIDLAQRESMNQSARFAKNLIAQLKRKTKVLRNTHRFAGFAVLKAPDVPSVLLELGFLSNPSDEKALRSSKYRARLASAVVKAAQGYFARIEEANRK